MIIYGGNEHNLTVATIASIYFITNAYVMKMIQPELSPN